MNQLKPEYYDGQSVIYAQSSIYRIIFEMRKPHRIIVPTENPNIDMDYVLKELREAIEYLSTAEAKLTGVIKIEFED